MQQQNHQEEQPLTEVWTADELMGNGSSSSPSKDAMERAASRRGNNHGNKQPSFRRPAAGKQVEPADWGRPGHLTPDEVDVYVSVLENELLLCFMIIQQNDGIQKTRKNLGTMTH